MASDRGVFKSTMGLSGATFLSRVLGLIREILTAQFIGGGMLMSAWALAFTLPNLFRRILGEGALGTALIPMISHTLEKEGQDSARRKFSTIVIWLTFLLALITVLVALPALLIEPYVTTERWKGKAALSHSQEDGAQTEKTRQFQSPLTRAALQADSTRLFMMKSRTPSSIGETLGSSNFSTQKETTSFNFIL